jgi:hypothetical protein
MLAGATLAFGDATPISAGVLPSGAPKLLPPVDGTNAGVGGRNVDGGVPGAPNAGVDDGVRRAAAYGGTLPLDDESSDGLGVALAGAAPNDSTEGAAALAADAGAGANSPAEWRTAGAAVDAPLAGEAASCNCAVPAATAGEDFAGVVVLAEVDGKSSAHRTLAPTEMSPPHTEQRARRLVPSTLAGSTRKTD